MPQELKDRLKAGGMSYSDNIRKILDQEINKGEKAIEQTRQNLNLPSSEQYIKNTDIISVPARLRQNLESINKTLLGVSQAIDELSKVTAKTIAPAKPKEVSVDTTTSLAERANAIDLNALPLPPAPKENDAKIIPPAPPAPPTTETPKPLQPQKMPEELNKLFNQAEELITAQNNANNKFATKVMEIGDQIDKLDDKGSITSDKAEENRRKLREEENKRTIVSRTEKDNIRKDVEEKLKNGSLGTKEAEEAKKALEGFMRSVEESTKVITTKTQELDQFSQTIAQGTATKAPEQGVDTPSISNAPVTLGNSQTLSFKAVIPNQLAEDIKNLTPIKQKLAGAMQRKGLPIDSLISKTNNPPPPPPPAPTAAGEVTPKAPTDINKSVSSDTGSRVATTNPNLASETVGAEKASTGTPIAPNTSNQNKLEETAPSVDPKSTPSSPRMTALDSSKVDKDTQKLFQYVKEGKINELKDALEQNPHNLLAQDAKGNTLFHTAAGFSKFEILDHLIERLPESNNKFLETKTTTLGNNALHIAIKNGLDESAEKMLRKNPELVNANNNEGLTPLVIAARSKVINVKTAECLLNYGAFPYRKDGSVIRSEQKGINKLIDQNIERGKIFFKAIQDGNVQTVEDMMREDKNILKSVNNLRETPFHVAIKNHRPQIFDKLMEGVVEENKNILKTQERNLEQTSLHYAAKEDMKNIAVSLFNKDNQLRDIADNQGRKPEDIAAHSVKEFLNDTVQKERELQNASKRLNSVDPSQLSQAAQQMTLQGDHNFGANPLPQKGEKTSEKATGVQPPQSPEAINLSDDTIPTRSNTSVSVEDRLDEGLAGLLAAKHQNSTSATQSQEQKNPNTMLQKFVDSGEPAYVPSSAKSDAQYGIVSGNFEPIRQILRQDSTNPDKIEEAQLLFENYGPENENNTQGFYCYTNLRHGSKATKNIATHLKVPNKVATTLITQTSVQRVQGEELKRKLQKQQSLGSTTGYGNTTPRVNQSNHKHHKGGASIGG